MSIFKIVGVVREKESRNALPGFFVKVYDQDLLYDDLMGTAYTGKDGWFTVLSQMEDFGNLLEARPDIYLKVFAPDSITLLYSGKHAVRRNAGHYAGFAVEIPRQQLGRWARVAMAS